MNCRGSTFLSVITLRRQSTVTVRRARVAREALPFLYRDPFRNAQLIATIERADGPAPDVWLAEDRGGVVSGALLVRPGDGGGRSAGLEAVDEPSARPLLGIFPRWQEVSFGLCRPWLGDLLLREFFTHHDSTMLTLRRDPDADAPLSVGASVRLGPEHRHIVNRSAGAEFRAGYLDALRSCRAADGMEVRAYGVIEAGRLVAHSLTTWADDGIHAVIGTVWSVFVTPSCRGRGLGKAVAAAATAGILSTGRVARYYSYADTPASIAIARQLGYREHHAIEYFHGRRR